MMVISPDEGATARAIYMSNVLGVDMGIIKELTDSKIAKLYLYTNRKGYVY